MPLPKYETMFVPVLRVLSDGERHEVTEIRQRMKVKFKITARELLLKYPKATSTRFVNLVAWVLAGLNQAKTVTLIKKGIYRVTDRGKTILKRHPASLTLKELIRE